MFITKKWAVPLLLLGLSSLSFAQSPNLDQHPSIQAANAKKEALLKLVEQSQLGFNPELELSTGRKNDGSTTGMTFETTLKQTLTFPGKQEARKALAWSEVTLQENKIKKLKSSLANEIWVKAAIWHLSLKKQEFNQKQFQKLSWVKSYLSSRPFVSPQKRLEIRIIESHLKEFQRENLHLTASVKTSRLALEALLQTNLSEPSDLPNIPKKSLNLDLNKAEITAQNPDIQELHLQLTQLELETKNLDTDANTDIDLLGRYATETASGTDRFLSFGLGFKLPFSNKNKFAVQAQDHKKKALELQLGQMIKEKEAQWQMAAIEATEAQATLALYTPTWISELENSVDQAIEGFKKDQTELLSVLELESQWKAAVTTSYDTQLDWIIAMSNLNQLLGKTEVSGDSL